jgi:hypothetical protein
METTQRLILITAAVLAIAAPTASARPAGEQPGGSNKPATAQKSDHSTIAAHHERITQEQWEAAAAEPEVALVDGTSDNGGRFPTGPVLLVAIGVPLGVVLMKALGKATARFRRSHRLA